MTGPSAVNGLFLVRASDRSPLEFILSFCHNRRVYHNKITKNDDGAGPRRAARWWCGPHLVVAPAGSFSNHNGTRFPSMTAMIGAYQSRHEDMLVGGRWHVPSLAVADLASAFAPLSFTRP